MSWTDERVALLKKLWGEGRTAAEIAKELGNVTRNAVIGKAHRLKLSNRVSPIQQNNKKPVSVPVSPPAAGKPEVRKAANDFTPTNIKIKGVSLADLKDRMCRWPIGDPKEAGFSFCGCQAVPSLPYCDEHARVAYQVATRSRVLKAEDFEEKVTYADDDIKEAASA